MSLSFYQKALAFDPDDHELLIDFANLQELNDAKAALDAYEKAEQLMERQGIPIKPELYNNIGVMNAKLGAFVNRTLRQSPWGLLQGVERFGCLQISR